MPVLVKDNIDTTGWATTAGAVALLDNLPRQDADEASEVVWTAMHCQLWRFYPVTLAAVCARGDIPVRSIVKRLL